jgi:23S rRNA (guanosine2251-2'-O)-methyltransferase
MKNQTNILVLDNIRSVQNVGAIFRTADAVGIDKIYLCGITPCPLDRFGKKRKDLAKSALGAEEFIDWEERKSIVSLIKKLKRENFKIISLEQDENSKHPTKIKLGEKNAFVLGSEVNGVNKKALELSDEIVEIPMKGKKESLNVSVATGIFLYHILKL